VDRRETDAIWAALEGTSNKSMIINMPFLPVNPDYGTTRNQVPFQPTTAVCICNFYLGDYLQSKSNFFVKTQ
jgi:hypothetical protein